MVQSPRFCFVSEDTCMGFYIPGLVWFLSRVVT